MLRHTSMPTTPTGDTRRCCTYYPYRRHTSLLQDFRLLLSLPYRRHTSLLPGPLDTPTLLAAVSAAVYAVVSAAVSAVVLATVSAAVSSAVSDDVSAAVTHYSAVTHYCASVDSRCPFAV